VSPTNPSETNVIPFEEVSTHSISHPRKAAFDIATMASVIGVPAQVAGALRFECLSQKWRFRTFKCYSEGSVC
jgi:hypothetical protein